MFFIIFEKKKFMSWDYFKDVFSVLKERGAYKIYALATHGLLSNARLIEESHIDEVVVTNSVPHDLQKMQCHKIKGDRLAEVFKLIWNVGFT